MKIFTGNLHDTVLPNASCVPADSLTARADQRSYDDASGGGQLRPETSYSFITGQVGDLIGGFGLPPS